MRTALRVAIICLPLLGFFAMSVRDDGLREALALWGWSAACMAGIVMCAWVGLTLMGIDPLGVEG